MKHLYIVLVIIIMLSVSSCSKVKNIQEKISSRDEKTWNDVTVKFQELEKKKQEAIKVINEKSSPKNISDTEQKVQELDSLSDK